MQLWIDLLRLWIYRPLCWHPFSLSFVHIYTFESSQTYYSRNYLYVIWRRIWGV